MLSTRSLVTLVPKLFENGKNEKKNQLLNTTTRWGPHCTVLGCFLTPLGLCLYGIAGEVVSISLLLGSSEHPGDPFCGIRWLHDSSTDRIDKRACTCTCKRYTAPSENYSMVGQDLGSPLSPVPCVERLHRHLLILLRPGGVACLTRYSGRSS